MLNFSFYPCSRLNSRRTFWCDLRTFLLSLLEEPLKWSLSYKKDESFNPSDVVTDSPFLFSRTSTKMIAFSCTITRTRTENVKDRISELQ